MEKPTIVFSPLVNALPAEGGAIDVLLRVQAPDLPEGEVHPYTPKRLAIVVDRSGSMDGRPLREALKCAAHIGKHLTPKDELALVVYDTKVDVLLPLAPVHSQEPLQRAISGVFSGGATNLHGGWLAGAQQLEAGSAPSISRVLLLSDGNANAGLINPAEITEQCSAWHAKGISTTTVGLGRGFNENLMVGMARAGGGQSYYGQAAEDLFDSFDEELALLQAMYLRELSIKLIPAAGVIVEMLSPATQRAGGSYALSDLAWSAESWLAVRLHITPAAPGTLRDLLAASLEGRFMDGSAVSVAGTLLQLPTLDAEAYAALAADEMVLRRLEELRFAKATAPLRELALRGDDEAVRELLLSLEREFGGNPWLQAKIEQLRELTDRDLIMMSKEAHYSSERLAHRITSKDEMAFVTDETHSEIPAFLRKKLSEGRGRTSE